MELNLEVVFARNIFPEVLWRCVIETAAFVLSFLVLLL